MVYQRFIDKTDTRARNVTVFVNNIAVQPWNPFCTEENRTEVVAQENSVSVQLPDGKKSAFAIKAYVVPRPEEFSSAEAAKKAKISNEYQGIYVYRENRLIQPATWMNMFRKEPHFTLLRVEFSFNHVLDLGFNVDIKKSRILLNETLFDWIQRWLTPPRNAAEQRYRKGQKKDAMDKTLNAHDGSNASIGAKEESVIISSVKILNEAANEAEVTNPQGTFIIKLPIIKPSKNGQIVVDPVESIDDGLLWEPCIIDTHHGVRINKGHEYYRKIYVPNLYSGVTIQGMDSLLWAICEAELGTMNAETKKHFNALRYEVSRLLRELVEDLPEPDLENGS